MGIKEEKPKDIPPQFTSILDKYQDVFPSDLPKGLPPQRHLRLTIPLVEGAKPTFRPLYRLSPKEHEEVRKQVADLLSKGWIEPSKSPFGSPILFVQKKDGTLRMCGLSCCEQTDGEKPVCVASNR